MNKKGILFWLPYLLGAGLAIWFSFIYPDLPATVPTHWNIKGSPDAFADKSMMIYMVLLPLGIPLLMDLLPFIDPRRQNYRDFASSYQKIKLGIGLFMSFIFWLSITTIISPDQQLSTRWMSFGLGVLFMLIGNYMSKVKNNFFVGIKTPWTLSSDEVWRRTHRLGGWLFFLAGLLTLISGQIAGGQLLFPVVMGGILIAAFVPIIYSYLIYRQLSKL